MTLPATTLAPRPIYPRMALHRTAIPRLGPSQTITPDGEPVACCPVCYFPGNYSSSADCPICRAGTAIQSWLIEHPGIQFTAAIADGTGLDLATVRIALARRVGMGWIASAPTGYRARTLTEDVTPPALPAVQTTPAPVVSISKARLSWLMQTCKRQRAALKTVTDEHAQQATVISRLTAQIGAQSRANVARFAETVKILTAPADQLADLEEQLGDLFARGFRIETMTSGPDGIAVLLTNPAAISRASLKR